MVAECFVQGQSVNRWMVSSSWAVAYRQYVTAFIADEADARQQRRNLWQGPFQMPADYRRSKREQAARQTPVAAPTMPGGCRIKGNISRQGKKLYHVPGQRDYERTSIDLSRGERMFCRPEEAARAGGGEALSHFAALATSSKVLGVCLLICPSWRSGR